MRENSLSTLLGLSATRSNSKRCLNGQKFIAIPSVYEPLLIVFVPDNNVKFHAFNFWLNYKFSG